MKCEHVSGRLSQMLDGVLGPIARLLVRRHLASCDTCAGKLEELRAMQATIRTKLPYHRAPPGLAARIGAALSLERAPPTTQPRFRPPPFSLPATGLAGAVAGVVLTMLVTGGQNSPTVAVIGGHIRSLQAEHLTDVQSSDQHTVKPWLSARVDISPPVRDLKDAGFPLVGGRLDYVAGHQAAALVYRHARHVINLFAWASSGKDEAFREETRQGFNIITWRRDGITYYAVSDVEADQLAAFAKLVAGEG